MAGISERQGGHHVAQKPINTTFPFREAAEMVLSFISLREKSGAFFPVRLSVSHGYCASAVSRRKAKTIIRHFISNINLLLNLIAFSLCLRISSNPKSGLSLRVPLRSARNSYSILSAYQGALFFSCRRRKPSRAVCRPKIFYCFPLTRE